MRDTPRWRYMAGHGWVEPWTTRRLGRHARTVMAVIALLLLLWGFAVAGAAASDSDSADSSDIPLALMPARKRPNQGPSHRQRHTPQSPESRKKARRHADAAAKAVKRKGETEEQRQARQQADAAAKVVKREGETEEERQARQQAHAEAEAARREGETEEQRQARQQADAAAKVVKREGETEEERQARQQADASRHKDSRRRRKGQAEGAQAGEPGEPGKPGPQPVPVAEHRAALLYTEEIFQGTRTVPKFTLASPAYERGRQPCDWCGALLWPCEGKRYGTRDTGYNWGGMATICCRQGKCSHLPAWKTPDPNHGSEQQRAAAAAEKDILDLWAADTEQGKLLREYARKVRRHRLSLLMLPMVCCHGVLSPPAPAAVRQRHGSDEHQVHRQASAGRGLGPAGGHAGQGLHEHGWHAGA